MNKITMLAAAGLLAAAGTGQAATLLTSGPTGATPLPSSQTFTFSGGAGAGSLAFDLRGFNTLDGQGAFSGGTDFSDLLTVTLNSTTIYSGYFVLGGIGSQNILVSAPGSTTAATSNGLDAGGTLLVTSAIALIEGTNTLRFSYTTPNPQPLADESWGLASVSVTGNLEAPPAVPEPATWAMLIVGFGLVGAAARRRRVPSLA